MSHFEWVCGCHTDKSGYMNWCPIHKFAYKSFLLLKLFAEGKPVNVDLVKQFIQDIEEATKDKNSENEEISNELEKG